MTLRAYGPDASFCPRCGAPLAGAPPIACGRCGYNLFVNPRPTACLIVLDGDPVTPRFLGLLRAAEPCSGQWATPGGFCNGWEHPSAAAVREGREELGVEVTLGDCVGMYLGSYEYQGETLPVLDVFYFAAIDAGEIRLDPAEASEMAWFELADPPKLAFETMNEAVRAAARQLGL
ncbi:NUDIX domain-containing protein [Micromonospora sp. NBC_01699]|uniref:NUDIX domain-containing protein n=1 Tax=Micromonospora sp. NBC_01699 TaxID=2975984 RepID=UPI002E2CB3FF|nr:NUDIX domain-containing protein [Micromonospora sp. NBC_01699]